MDDAATEAALLLALCKDGFCMHQTLLVVKQESWQYVLLCVQYVREGQRGSGNLQETFIIHRHYMTHLPQLVPVC